MNSEPQRELSVVILCYRAGDYAKIFCSEVKKILESAHINYELILVGNYIPGENDTTPEIVKKLAVSDERVRAVVKEKSNLNENGMGWDMRSGFEAATGKTIAVIDGDGQMPPENIIRLYNKLIEGNFDLVKALRISREDGPYRKFISQIYNFIMRAMFPGIAPNDINGKPKLFTRKAYEKLNLESNDWFIDAEIMIKARRYGFRIGEIDTSFFKNKERGSFISFQANLEFLKNMLIWRIKEFRAQK